MKRVEYERGFLLVEAVVGIGIAVALGSILVTGLFQMTHASQSAESKIDIASEIRTSTIWLTRDIHRASETGLIDGGDPAASGPFQWSDEAGRHDCTYRIQEGNIVRACASGTKKIVARRVSDLTFQRSGRLVQVEFTLADGSEGSNTQTVRMHVALKNASGS